MKPGYKTTEFWLTLVATALSFLLAQGVITEDQIAVVTGYIGLVLPSVGYSVSRSVAKVGKNGS